MGRERYHPGAEPSNGPSSRPSFASSPNSACRFLVRVTTTWWCWQLLHHRDDTIPTASLLGVISSCKAPLPPLLSVNVPHPAASIPHPTCHIPHATCHIPRSALALPTFEISLLSIMSWPLPALPCYLYIRIQITLIDHRQAARLSWTTVSIHTLRTCCAYKVS